MDIKSWEESKQYKKFKKEVCTQEIFESRLFDDKGNPYGEYGTTHSTTLFTHIALLRYLLDQKHLFNPSKIIPVIIDLGSGTANIAIYAAHQGWKAIGIEFSKGCYDTSIENIEKAEKVGYIPENSIEIIHSNFFPKGFKIQKIPNNSIEDDFRKDLETCEKKCKKRINPNILKEGDLFFHYQVERRQNILDLFSKYAKKGAMLVYVASKEDAYNLPEDVVELDNHLDMYIYQKQ